MYIHNVNATGRDPFPTSCCVSDIPKNASCPKTVKDAQEANPDVFKKTVRNGKNKAKLPFISKISFRASDRVRK